MKPSLHDASIIATNQPIIKSASVKDTWEKKESSNSLYSP